MTLSPFVNEEYVGESRDSGYVFMSRNHETSPNPIPNSNLL